MSDALVNGLAGASGGIIAQLLTYPLQAVNTRQQTERKERKNAQREAEREDGRANGEDQELVAIQKKQEKKTRGTLQELWEIMSKEGWGGLYRGLQPSLIGTACSQGVYYYFYQLFRDRAVTIALQRQKNGRGDGSVGMLASLLVAAMAGCANVLLTNPIWIIVTRMQTQSQVKKRMTIEPTPTPNDSSSSKKYESMKGSREVGSSSLEKPKESISKEDTRSIQDSHAKPQGAIATVLELHREAGILGFWKGVFPTLVMVSNPAIQFAIYESLMAKITAKRPLGSGVKSATATEIFALGAIAKLGATVITYPLLVVKSRLQARQDIGMDVNSRYTGTLDAVLKMLRYEGVHGFYKGMSTKIVQSVFAAAVLFLTKEELVKLTRLLVERREKLNSSRKLLLVKK